jgi:hypothetical protein
MELNFDEFNSGGGLHVKRVVSTWNLGTIHAWRFMLKKMQEDCFKERNVLFTNFMYLQSRLAALQVNVQLEKII